MENWEKKIKLEDDELVTSYFSKFFNLNIPIIFVETADKVRPKQALLVTGLIENEMNWIDESLKAILEYYKEAYPGYRKGWELGDADEETIEQYLPKEINQIKLLKLITPAEIYINPEEDCESGTFGFGLECEWDTEHGLGVYFNDWKVCKTGGMGIAFGY